MSQQLSHLEHKFTPRAFNITVICDHLESPANQGALFRICEAFGVHQIIFFGNRIDLKSSRLKRTARNTEKKISYKCISDIKQLIEYLQQTKSLCIGLEITKNSLPLKKLEIPKNKSITIVIGNEKNGISEHILLYLDQAYHIPMYGANSSMNVIQATSIALYTITNNY